MPEGLKKTLAGSLLLHVVVLTLLAIYRAEPKRVFFSPVYTVNLVEPGRAQRRKRPAVKKEKTPTVKKKAAKKPAAKKTRPIKKEKAVVIKKKAERPRKAAAVSEAIEKIKKKVEEKEKRAAIESKLEEIRKRVEKEALAPRIEEIKKGLKETAGEGPAPAAGGVRHSDFEIRYKAYFAALRDRVQENWIYPEKFDRRDVSVIVSVRIARDGRLIRVWVEKSSGNKVFDLSLVDAVKKASPFPPLPVDYEGEYLDTGLRFCPECTS